MQTFTRSSARPVRPVSRFGLHRLHTPPVTRALLDHERGRADRNGGEFSLVLFSIQKLGRSRALQRLARLLAVRARATDAVGWFDSGTVCAILPDTSAVGARCFAQHMAGCARDRSLSPACVIHTYPSRWADSDQNDGTPGASDQRSNMRIGVDDAPKAIPALKRSDLLPSVMKGMVDELSSGDLDQKNLNMLLARRMPLWKRTLDVLGAACGVLLFSPLMIIAAVSIRLSSEGPVMFKQRRAGLGGEVFTIYKFRTMIPQAEAQKSSLRAQSEQDGPAFKLQNDPRVTRIGRFLRKTSLDELPQLLNVLKGDMSLVGPRPLPVDESNACDQWHRHRLSVTPGITCFWQVKGRSSVTFDEWMRMDLQYARRRSLVSDLRILFATLPAVLLRRGAQ